MLLLGPSAGGRAAAGTGPVLDSYIEKCNGVASRVGLLRARPE